jgi:hypothetical protein
MHYLLPADYCPISFWYRLEGDPYEHRGYIALAVHEGQTLCSQEQGVRSLRQRLSFIRNQGGQSRQLVELLMARSGADLSAMS